MSGITLTNERLASLRTLLADPVPFPDTNYGIAVNQIEYNGGRWTEDDRRRYYTTPPTVVLSCDGTSPIDYPEEAGGTVRPRFMFSCIVVARDAVSEGERLHRSQVAQAVAEFIASSLYYDRTTSATFDISRMRVENLWDSLPDKNDVGMWGLTWEEGGSLPSTDTSDLPDLITVRTEYEIAANDDEPQVVGNVTFAGTDDPDLPDPEAP